MREFYLISILVIQVVFGFSQNTSKTTTQESILKSDIVIEAEIVGKHSFWNLQHRNIYTAFELKITTTLRGYSEKNPNLLLMGGKVDDILQIVSTSPELKIGDRGIFMMRKLTAQNNISNNSDDYYFLLNSKNSFTYLGNESLKVESVNGNESHVDFVNEIERISGKKLKYNTSTQILKSTNSAHKITGFSPKTVTAGTGTTLNIYGEGFGATQEESLVWFTNADNPNQIITNQDFQILAWSDNQIQMVVPTDIASGKIIVDIDGTKVESGEKLTVKYNVIQQNYLPVYLINKNNKGGYTFHPHSNLSSFSGAQEIIENSIKEWICATSVPWEIGNTMSVEPGDDNICSIQFGDLSNSGGETLGQASYFLESSSSNPTEFVLSEVDIVFSNTENWCFDNSNIKQQQIDFASVVLHELGHAHLIGHVNQTTNLMHYVLLNGETRNIAPDNVLCGEYIVNSSLTYKNNHFKTITISNSTPPVFSVNKDSLYSINEYNTYQWLLNGSKISNATQRKFVISASGKYSLEVTDENNCWHLSESVDVVKSDPGQIDTIFTFTCPPNSTTACADNIPLPFSNYTNFKSAGGTAISTPSPIDETTFNWEGDISDSKTCPETITRTYSIKNKKGYIVSCEQLIIVNDIEKPKLVLGNKIFSCPDNKPEIYTNKVQFEAGLGNSAGDNCELDWTTFKYLRETTDGKKCPETIERWYEIKDKCGNRSEAKEKIIINDLTAPTIICPADASFDAGLGEMENLTGLAYSETEKQIFSANFAGLGISVSDNCLVEKVTYRDINTNSCPIKINRTFFVYDACGNYSTAIQKIEFTQGITLSEKHENDGASNLNTGNINLTVSGGIPPYQFMWSNSETTEDIDNLASGTYLVDVWDSNKCTASLSITIDSETATLKITCPAQLTVSCNKDIDQSVYADYAEFKAASGSALSDCGINPYSFVWAGDEILKGSDCINIDRTYFVKDSCGTTASCVQSVTVKDEVPPVLNCPTEITIIGEMKPEHYENYAVFIAAGGSADDNCSIDEDSFKWIKDLSDGKTNPETVTRTYQIADFCGNETNCEQTIKLYENSGIFINCPSNMTILCSENEPATPSTYADFLAEGGFAGSSPDFPLVESSFLLVTDKNNDSGNCEEYITRIFSIKNENGDIATCEQQITIINPTASTLSCPPDILIHENENIPDGYNSLNEFITAGGIFSNTCETNYDGLYIFSNYKDTLLTANVVERTYSISDVCGNYDFCIQKLSIENTTQSFDNKWNEKISVNIFPNPSKGKFSIEAGGLKNKKISLTIYNSIGDRVYQDNLVSVNGRLKKDMDLSDVAGGVYFIKIQDGNKSDTQSIIIE